jgi:DNA topoisomerase-3
VRRTKYGYGCSAYKEGCKFRVGAYICGRAISKRNVSLMLESGRTSLIRGFVSKRTGKSFDAFLRLEGEGCVFDFSVNPIQNQNINDQ